MAGKNENDCGGYKFDRYGYEASHIDLDLSKVDVMIKFQAKEIET